MPAAAHEAPRPGTSRSTSMTRAPRSASRHAMAVPITPPPMMMVSGVLLRATDVLLEIAAGEVDVMLGTSCDPVGARARELAADLRGSTRNQAPRGNDHSRGHHAQRRDQRF